MKRLIALALVAGLIGGVAAALPAEAKKKKKRCFAGCVILPPPCPAYVPGEAGSGAETAVVTDAATEAAPLEVPITAARGLQLGFPTDDVTAGHVYTNIQVDTFFPQKGLYVRLEFDNAIPLRDYDIWLNYADGTNASNAHGFNPAPDSQLSPASDGGHTEGDAEQIDGTASNDCQGYTLDLSTSTGEGGDMTLKMWLGEVQYTPVAP